MSAQNLAVGCDLEPFSHGFTSFNAFWTTHK
jgi:hypothetical protein